MSKIETRTETEALIAKFKAEGGKVTRLGGKHKNGNSLRLFTNSKITEF